MCFEQLNLHSALLRLLLLDDGAPDVTHLAVLHHSGRTIRGRMSEFYIGFFGFMKKNFVKLKCYY